LSFSKSQLDVVLRSHPTPNNTPSLPRPPMTSHTSNA
jgi:hypothetical protein